MSDFLLKVKSQYKMFSGGNTVLFFSSCKNSDHIFGLDILNLHNT